MASAKKIHELTEYQLRALLFSFCSGFIESHPNALRQSWVDDLISEEIESFVKDDDFMHGIYMLDENTTEEQVKILFNIR